MRLTQKSKAAKYLKQARQYVQADCYDAAIRALDLAIACTPTAKMYDYRGVVLSLAGRVEEALESFARALEKASLLLPGERAEICFHRGLLYGREGASALARVDFSRAVKLSSDPTYREALAEIERELACQAGPV